MTGKIRRKTHFCCGNNDFFTIIVEASDQGRTTKKYKS